MQEIAFKCDICKRTIDATTEVTTQIGDKMHDLCPDCWKKLEKLLNNTGRPVDTSILGVLTGAEQWIQVQPGATITTGNGYVLGTGNIQGDSAFNVSNNLALTGRAALAVMNAADGQFPSMSFMMPNQEALSVPETTNSKMVLWQESYGKFLNNENSSAGLFQSEEGV